jgi:IclR family transcriptional regulator, KDG regulon repressor
MASGEIQSLSRAIAILDCFGPDRPQLGVREIARTLGMSASTVGRLLAALHTARILNQDPATRLYRMGPKVMAWSSVYANALEVRDCAQPMLEELHKLTSETVSLYALERGERVCVAAIESPEVVRVVVREGERMPLHAGSSGKVLLAFMPPEEIEAVLARPLEKMTTNTITGRKAMLKELDGIRAKGFATSNAERFTEVIGLAAPIFDAVGRVVAALNVAGPKMRFTESHVEKFAPKVMQLADRISHALGYSGPAKSNGGKAP